MKKIKEKENWDYAMKDKSFFDSVQIVYPEGPIVKFIYPDGYIVVKSYNPYSVFLVTDKMIRESYYGTPISDGGSNYNKTYVAPMINPSIIPVPSFLPTSIPAFAF